MTRVVWVEPRRAWARRLVWFFLLASVGAVTAISLSLFATHEKAAPRTETIVPGEAELRHIARIDIGQR